MNYQNIKEMIKFFEAGAPHITFDMSVGVLVPRTFNPDEELPLSDCGTHACLAGIASQMELRSRGYEKYQEIISGQFFEDNRNAEHPYEGDWDLTRNLALEWLGLERHRLTLWAGHIGHPLFDPREAPSQPTPAEAVIALRALVAEWENPWEAVKLHREGTLDLDKLVTESDELFDLEPA